MDEERPYEVSDRFHESIEIGICSRIFLRFGKIYNKEFEFVKFFFIVESILDTICEFRFDILCCIINIFLFLDSSKKEKR